jgi:hypothetical protein
VEWTVHGERTLYDSPWVGLALVDVEVPGGVRFDHHVHSTAVLGEAGWELVPLRRLNGSHPDRRAARPVLPVVPRPPRLVHEGTSDPTLASRIEEVSPDVARSLFHRGEVQMGCP